MNVEEALDFLGRITYKPGYTIAWEHPSRDHLRRLELPHTVRMYVRAEVPDTYHPERTTVLAFIHDIRLRPGMTPHDLLLQVRYGFRELEMHELDEWLCWQGDRPFDPHKQSV